MNAKDVIRGTLATSNHLVSTYIGDLSDDELLVRPLAGTNHIAWQIGHLIAVERMVLEAIQPGSCPPLPEGFDEGHGRQSFTVDDPAKFLPRDAYLDLWKAQREATVKVLDGLNDEQLDAPAPERLRHIAPTVGAAINFMGLHGILHAGQFPAIRRKLSKPIVI